MKIAIFSEIYTPHIGGSISLASDLMDALIAEGNEVLIVASSPKANGFILKDNVLLCPAKKYNNVYGFAFDKDKLSDLTTYIENFKPDVIHINSASPIGIAALEICDKLDLPSIFYINEKINSNSLLTSLKERSIFKKLATSSDVLVGVSPIVQQNLDLCKIERKFLICPLAVNTEFFDCNKILPVKSAKIRDYLHLQDSSFVAVFSGFLTDDTGIESIFNAWAKNISIDDNMKLLIIGDGPAKSHLVSLAKDISIQKQIVFTGAVRRDRIPSLFSICDIFISGNINTFTSVSMLEAISCGLPAIIPSNSSNLFQLKEGITGFSYRNDEEMIKYLKRFKLLDGDGKKALRNLVRKNALENKATSYARRMISIYNRAMQVHFFHDSTSKENTDIEEVNVFDDDMTDISKL